MRNRSYETNFRLDLMAKDLAYSHAEARQAGIELSTATTALARFEEAIRSGLGGSDLSAVVEAIRRSE
jgi:3-hydroxyisobutyrate dehydrogenase-like beta-hydroxyacid dehydrogenase